MVAAFQGQWSCEADKSFPRQEIKLDAAGLRRAATAGGKAAAAGSKRASSGLTALQQSQQILQQEVSLECTGTLSLSA